MTNPARTVQPAAECRTCGAPIAWAITDRGRRIPIDPKPVPDALHADGQWTPGLLAITLDAYGVAHARAWRKGEPRPDATLYASHFATCPQANAHRKR